MTAPNRVDRITERVVENINRQDDGAVDRLRGGPYPPGHVVLGPARQRDLMETLLTEPPTTLAYQRAMRVLELNLRRLAETADA